MAVRKKESGLELIIAKAPSRPPKATFGALSFNDLDGRQEIDFVPRTQKPYAEFAADFIIQTLAYLRESHGATAKVHPEIHERLASLNQSHYAPQGRGVTPNSPMIMSERMPDEFRSVLRNAETGVDSFPNDWWTPKLGADAEHIEGELYCTVPRIAARCNGSAKLGIRHRLRADKAGFVDGIWEVYDLSGAVDYLRAVHEETLGTTWTPGNPYKLDSRGLCLPQMTHDEILRPIDEAYQETTIPVLFGHMQADVREGQAFLRHMDGAILDISLDRLRHRLFDINDRSRGDTPQENYTKLWKVDWAPGDARVPIYSTTGFEPHDLMSVYLGRSVL